MKAVFIREVSDTSKRIAARIVGRRRSLGMSQADLADSLGWPVRRLSRIENASREVHLYDVEPIAAELRKPVEWFERPFSIPKESS